MPSVWLVTPAYRRYDMSAVCFRQHKQVIDVLRSNGIDAQQVVVADDENLDIARSLGFATVEQGNAWLGQKFNDGIEYAARQGASWIVPIGSDSWIDPAYFLPLPQWKQTRTGNLYTVVTRDEYVNMPIKLVGPYMFHRSLLEPSGFRPAEDRITKGVDSSTLQGIGKGIHWAGKDDDPLQYVGFRSAERYLSAYQSLKRQYRDEPEPTGLLWPQLETIYGAKLVADMQRVRLGSSGDEGRRKVNRLRANETPHPIQRFGLPGYRHHRREGTERTTPNQTPRLVRDRAQRI